MPVSAAEPSEITFVNGQRHSKDLERDLSSKGQQIIELAEITPGMQVLDLFGGGGYYSELLAKAVGGSGKVYLHNNQAYMPWVEKELDARLKDNRLPNVIRYDRETEDLGIVGKNFDAIFYVLGYHDIYHTVEGWKIDRDSFLKQLKSALKPNGTLVIIDHAADVGTGTQASQELHRIDPNYVKNELSELGFSLVKQSDLLANKADDHTLTPFDAKIRRKTDRFVLMFTKNH